MIEDKIAFRFDKSDLEGFDRLISLMGFQSRSDYFRSCVSVTVHGAALIGATGKLDPITDAWIKCQKAHSAKKLSEEESLQKMIGEVSHSVIAMKGVKTAYRVLRDDMIREMVKETGRVFTADEIMEAMKAYQTYHRTELDDYRTNTAREMYASED